MAHKMPVDAKVLLWHPQATIGGVDPTRCHRHVVQEASWSDMADNATLKSQYLAQVETDLEGNTKERERLTADLAALREQLTVLEQDRELLEGVQQTLVSSSASTPQVSGPVAVPVDVSPAGVPRARKPKAAARTPKPATGKKATAKADTPAKSASGGALTLRELAVTDLAGHSEPRSAVEITTALAHAHPDRKIQATVVRNTLEALVAKGHAVRSKQGRSVYYSSGTESDSATVAADESAVISS
jgi:hypothetical protein